MYIACFLSWHETHKICAWDTSNIKHARETHQTSNMRMRHIKHQTCAWDTSNMCMRHINHAMYMCWCCIVCLSVDIFWSEQTNMLCTACIYIYIYTYIHIYIYIYIWIYIYHMGTALTCLNSQYACTSRRASTWFFSSSTSHDSWGLTSVWGLKLLVHEALSS
jgi:hypothetical protein